MSSLAYQISIANLTIALWFSFCSVMVWKTEQGTFFHDNFCVLGSGIMIWLLSAIFCKLI